MASERGEIGAAPARSSGAAAVEGLESFAPGPAAVAFRVALPAFEGPLDLLLHLIREHRLDIFDIPISLITEKYLEALKKMRDLDLDVAGEFILMAATLAHIKSRMLLPNPDPQLTEEEQGDPRAELGKRLLEYQKYKDAGEELGRMDILDRVVFTRRARAEQIPLSEGEIGLVEVSVFKLIEALDQALQAAELVVPHQVIVDRISLGDAISSLVDRLKKEPRTSFTAVLEGVGERQKIVVTFLALLEMCKLGLIRIYQEEGQDDILISARDPDALTPVDVKDEYQ